MTLSVIGAQGQEATFDYIYSPEGFEVKEGVIEINFLSQNRTFTSTGLYSKDGKILVSAITTNGYNRFYVLDGCETICSGAFQGMVSMDVFIPSSVKYIAPDAIISRSTYGDSNKSNRYAGIQDGCYEEQSTTRTADLIAEPEASETAVYNLQGIRLSEPGNGINILKNSDGKAEKVLIK